MKSRFLSPLIFGALCVQASAADPFAEGVRPTEPLNPAEQRNTFSLPPGFDMQLVASEPDIRKPMNMAFDHKGRLWLTDSREYPFAAPLDKPGRDAIKIFEDFDETGRARKITTFVDGLNIPTGVYPYKNGVIAWSIPNIWYFEDTDGDGKADKRTILFGPLGWERDTHGMDSSFRRGFDGWLYMTHGFNNNTTVRGRDGSEIKMNSGNTYRVRLDGSRVEQHTWGQVNPFGLCFDPAGNMYSADCHSAPVYELLRGGYYPSFGKPHDGLGFAPTMIEHSHGSTAIAGIQYYSDNLWPDEFRNNTFIGNVMTSRINRDSLSEHGSSKIAREEPDLVTTSDPWFRPVDIQFGPDGAMYIADFYNRIIGHYEVPLTHPGRDRERGRIWRLVYKKTHPKFDISSASAEEIIAEMASPNMTRRMLAMNELVDRLGANCVPAVKAQLRKETSSPLQIAHSLWVLHRLGALESQILEQAASHSDRLVRTHAMRVLSETKNWGKTEEDLAMKGLADNDALVKRAAADALGQHPAVEHVESLVALRSKVAAEDNHLLHTVRMALRNQLIPGQNLAHFNDWQAGYEAIADVALGIQTPQSGTFLLNYLKSKDAPVAVASQYVKHISRFIEPSQVPALAEFTQSRFTNDFDQQLSFFKSLQEGSAQRGAALPESARAWGAKLAEHLLVANGEDESAWKSYPVENAPISINPWFLQQRDSADGNKGSWFISSLPPGGERLTGVLRSPLFAAPEKLSFFLAGHDGFPDKPAQRKNLIRLVDGASGEILAQTFPPRDDTARAFSWDLKASRGRMVAVEVVDGDTGEAYAWMAAGRFSPPVVRLPKNNPKDVRERQIAAADLAQSLGLKHLSPKLGTLLESDHVEMEARTALARALVNLAPNENRLALVSLVGDAAVPPGLRTQIAKTLAKADDTESLLVLTEAMRGSPLRIQTRLAQSLAASPTGAATLLKLIEQNQASSRILRDKTIQDKLNAMNENGIAPRVQKMIASLPPANDAIQAQIESRRSGFTSSKPQAVDGGKVFLQNCSVCHQVEGTGALIAPQLDGIGGRGMERLLEDIIDPNRNVDRAFRTHIIVLKDGDIVTGLPRREEGEVLVLADSGGKEINIPKKDIAERRESETSLMPENFGELLSVEDFNNLIAFLMSKGPAPRKD